MTRPVAVIVLLGAAAVAFSAAWLPGSAPGVAGTPTPVQPVAAAPVTAGRVVGVAGCASAACHGGPASASLSSVTDPRRWACSATHFLATDPHTRAYAALEGDLAADIMRRMRRPGPATEDVRCLACHTTPALATATDPREVALRQDGVGCEACHGNAGGWLHAHTTWTAATRAAGYAQTGMTKLFDLGERAVTCAGCHVGAPADEKRGEPVRDMNHDMIAAGHPRLNFDFADYQHALPRHWTEADRSPDFEARAWLVGRVAHAEAACRLLEDRAKRAAANDPRTPWPEYAEWNCVSCHHNLGAGFPDPTGGRKPGAPAWQPVWPVTSPSDFAALERFGRPELEDLLKVIETPRPTIAGAAPAAHAAAQSLSRVRAAVVAAPLADGRAALPAVLTAPLGRVAGLDRDTAGQLYHGLAAFERAQSRPVPPQFETVRAALTAPRGNLRFDVPPPARAALSELLKRVK